MNDLIQLILHPDVFLSQMSLLMGVWIYVLVFLIVFAETGLVVTPFLPGDSLLFALGAMASLDENPLSYELLSVVLILATFCGDNVNYMVGRKLGLSLFQNPNSKFFRRKHLQAAENFIAKNGVRAVLIARFIPIVRTFVPFAAGLGRMEYKKFMRFSIFGALLWIQIFLAAGKIFGNLPAVKRNFHILILAVIVLSVLPMLWAGFMNYRKSRSSRVEL